MHEAQNLLFFLLACYDCDGFSLLDAVMGSYIALSHHFLPHPHSTPVPGLQYYTHSFLTLPFYSCPYLSFTQAPSTSTCVLRAANNSQPQDPTPPAVPTHRSSHGHTSHGSLVSQAFLTPSPPSRYYFAGRSLRHQINMKAAESHDVFHKCNRA